MTPPVAVFVLVGVLGLAVGSFLNVVIYRVPREKSIMFPASHCTSCETPIKPWHNVPVLSWLALRGRCATCRVAISWRYPLVEAATAALFLAITLRFGLSSSIVLPSYVVGAVLLIPAGAVDGDWAPALRALVGMSVLWVIFFALAIACPLSVSFSDAALGGLIGLYLGWLSWGALLIGGFGALVIGVATGATLSAAGRTDRESAVPFGSCLIVASALAAFIAVPVTHWYGSIVTFA